HSSNTTVDNLCSTDGVEYIASHSNNLTFLALAIKFVIKSAGISARTDEGEGTFVTEQDTLQTPADSGSAGLGSLKLAQLQTLASQLGITGTSRMRKAQLVEVIADHQRGGDSADREAVEEAKAAAAKERKSRSASAKAKAGEQPVTDDAPAEEPKQRSGDQSKRDAQRSKQGETDAPDDDRDLHQRTRNQQRRDQDRQRKANRDQHDKSDKDKADKRDQQSKRDQQDKHDKQDKRDQQGGDEAQDDHRDGNRRRRDDDQRNQRRQRQRDRNRSRDRRDDHEQDDRHEG